MLKNSDPVRGHDPASRDENVSSEKCLSVDSVISQVQ